MESGEGWARASRSAAICDMDLRGVGIETEFDRMPCPGMNCGYHQSLIIIIVV